MTFPVNAAIDAPTDVGTIWTMRLAAQVARCALMARLGEWELRVIVDGVTRLTERCERGSQAFAVAEEWRRRMLIEGWCQVVPRQTIRVRPPRRPARR